MSNLSHRLARLSAPLQAAWAQRNPREQQLLNLLGLLVCAAALWLMALAPALKTVHEAPARQASLDSQTRTMRALLAEANSLKKPTAITRNEATRWLESSVAQTLGSGSRISVHADRATLTLQATPAAELSRWLSQAREQAQALPLQGQLQQTPATTGPAKTPPPADSDAGVRWSGTLVLSLP